MYLSLHFSVGLCEFVVCVSLSVFNVDTFPAIFVCFFVLSIDLPVYPCSVLSVRMYLAFIHL